MRKWAIDVLHQLVQQNEAAEVAGDAFHTMDLRRGHSGESSRVCGQPHRHCDACRIDAHRGRIAREDAHQQNASRGAAGPDPPAAHDRHHAEGGNHEVDSRARLRDEEETLTREIALPRFPLERHAGQRGHEYCRRAEDPLKLVNRRLGVVTLHPPHRKRRE